ncbi:hypothetical protein HDZ31DRAFT_33706 [Schizophyllum fasciatum]
MSSNSITNYFKPRPKNGNERKARGSHPYTHSPSPPKPETVPVQQSPAPPQERRKDARTKRKEIADDTLAAIEAGCYSLDGQTYPLSDAVQNSERETRYYSPDSALASWESAPAPQIPGTRTAVTLAEISTLEGARLLISQSDGRVGVLNFASATKPGGGFLSGASAQEESIARSSTLYPTLKTPDAEKFYRLHKKRDTHGFYTHAMIYSPSILVFRTDDGQWLPPYEVDILTSPAVNAGVVREKSTERSEDEIEGDIGLVMRDRMARLLFLFEQMGVKNIVLGSFGTGVFKNDVKVVAGIWVDLLFEEDARFSQSFDRVVFAILGNATFEDFRLVFSARGVSL